MPASPPSTAIRASGPGRQPRDRRPRPRRSRRRHHRSIGGRVELLGGLFYALRKPAPDQPLFVLEDGCRAALTWAYNGPNYQLHARYRSGSTGDWQEDRAHYHRGPALWSLDAAGR